jgi:AcrR family transcriptional regulator
VSGESDPSATRLARECLTYAGAMSNRSSGGIQAAERAVRTRRGGAEVQQAITDAVVVELAEVGFGRLTFDSVAERAGTGKSPLYRRWPDTTALVIDALETLGMDPAGYARSGDLRKDLIGFTRYMTRTHQGVKGAAFRSLLGEAHRYPELLDRFKAQVLAPLFDALTELLRDAAKRGEVSSKRLTPVVLEVLHALVIKRLLLDSHDLTTKDITEIVDQVLLPLVVG